MITTLICIIGLQLEINMYLIFLVTVKLLLILIVSTTMNSGSCVISSCTEE